MCDICDSLDEKNLYGELPLLIDYLISGKEKCEIEKNKLMNGISDYENPFVLTENRKEYKQFKLDRYDIRILKFDICIKKQKERLITISN